MIFCKVRKVFDGSQEGGVVMKLDFKQIESGIL